MKPETCHPNTGNCRRKTLGLYAAAAALLGLHAFLAIDALLHQSVTLDEVGHLPAGLSYWQKGTFRLYSQNPPLVKLAAALPALALRPEVDYTKSWAQGQQGGSSMGFLGFSWEFMYANAGRYHEIYFWGRLPVVGFSLLAGWIIFLWSREIFGAAAGLLGLALWCFNPNVIAHAGLVTTDMGAASMGVASTYVFWRYLGQPRWPRAFAAGALLGLAQLTKFSMLLLLVCWPLVWLAAAWERWRGGQTGKAWGRWLARSAAQGGLIFLTALAVMNLGYLFEGTGTRLGDFPFRSKEFTRLVRAGGTEQVSSAPVRQNRFRNTWLGEMPILLPYHYVKGLDSLLEDAGFVPGVYLFGKLREVGGWGYYLFALLLKTPLGTLCLLLFALTFALFHAEGRASLAQEMALVLPAAVILLALSLSLNTQLGLRYVLPAFPFGFILLSRLGRIFVSRSRFQAWVVGLALAWDAVSCARSHRDHLAYFNELGGGPESGHLYLLDSNVDWGQDLLRLAERVRLGQIPTPFGLAYFGRVDPGILPELGKTGAEGVPRFLTPPPARLSSLRLSWIRPGGRVSAELDRGGPAEEPEGIDPSGQPPEGNSGDPNRVLRIAAEVVGILSPTSRTPGLEEGPRPGFFAISISFVKGYPFLLRDSDGNLWYAVQNAYSYFQQFQPCGKVGYSIFLYDVSQEDANRVRARLGLPLLPGKPGVERLPH